MMDAESAHKVLQVVGLRLRTFDDTEAAVEAIRDDYASGRDGDKVVTASLDGDYTGVVVAALRTRLGADTPCLHTYDASHPPAVGTVVGHRFDFALRGVVVEVDLTEEAEMARIVWQGQRGMDWVRLHEVRLLTPEDD